MGYNLSPLFAWHCVTWQHHMVSIPTLIADKYMIKYIHCISQDKVKYGLKDQERDMDIKNFKQVRLKNASQK